MDEARQALDELISSRKGCTYSGISRLLGRNVSYIQQYIRKGSPRYLDELSLIPILRCRTIERGITLGFVYS